MLVFSSDCSGGLNLRYSHDGDTIAKQNPNDGDGHENVAKGKVTVTKGVTVTLPLLLLKNELQMTMSHIAKFEPLRC